MTGIGQTGNRDLWGNGAAIARLFASQGAKVFGCDVSLNAAEYTAKRIASEGGDITVMPADVTSNDSVKAAVAACMAKYGKIDILIK